MPENVEKIQNWVKSSLGLRITREGVLGLVKKVIKEFHKESLSEVLSSEQIKRGELCTKCQTENILKCPTRGFCTVRAGKCSAHDKKQCIFRPCPNGICDMLRNAIIRGHSFHNPSWRNTHADQWCQSPWEMAKCFMPPSEYLEKTSIDETDLDGLLSIMSNLKRFDSRIPKVDLREVRDIGRQIRLCSDFCVDEVTMNKYLDEMILFLTSSGDLACESKEAVLKLKKLKENDIVLGDIETATAILFPEINNHDYEQVPDDFMHDSYALDLYKKALQEGTEEDRSIRINIVGNFGQGKTSLVRRLVGESIEGVQSTNGIAVDRYEYKRDKDGTFSYVRKTTLDNSDIGNRLALVARASTMEQGDKYGYDNLEPLDYDKAESAEVQEKIQETVIYQRNTEQDDLYQSVNSHPVQCTSQSHEKRKNRQCLTEEALKIFKECLQSNNTSANDNNIPVSFDIWDFGGQHTFYATHTIFHSRRAIYLLVFNLSLNLKEQADNKDKSADCFLPPRNRDMAYYIRFWMNSINSFVGNEDGTEPPVILVGTHKDKLSGNEEDRTRQADNYFCDVRDLFEEPQVRKHIRQNDYAIDNTNRSDESIQLLREALIQLGEDKSKTVLVPAKWIQLEKSVFEKRADKIISLAMVIQMDLGNEFPIDNIEGIKLFLKYLHDKGTVCYFDEEPLSNHVIVDPQYLIDSFKCIITSRIFCKKDPELTDSWTKLFNEAKLENSLIDRVWDRDTDNAFSKNKSILIAFLKKHHIISEVMIYDSTKEIRKEGEWFLVPSLLRNHSSETSEIDDYLRGKQQSLSRYVLKFKNIAVVATIYHRIVAASLGYWIVAQYRATSLIYENLLALKLDLYYYVGLIEMKNNYIDLTVVSLCPSKPVDPEIADKFRRFVESVVDYEFDKLKVAAGKLKKQYKTKLRCNNPEHGFTGSIKLMKIDQLPKINKLPCPDSMSHEINIEMTRSEWFQDGKGLQKIPREQLSDKCLSKISTAIGENWQLLGIELGVTEVEIQHIVIDNPYSVVMRIYKMLLKWKEKAADSATMDELEKAMRKRFEVYVDWDVIRNVIDEIIRCDSSEVSL